MHIPNHHNLRRLPLPSALVAFSLLAAAPGHAEQSAGLAPSADATSEPPSSAVSTAEPPASVADPHAAPDAHHGSLSADPLGFLMFGPTLGGEVRLGPASLTAYGRWLSGGLLAQSTFETDVDEFAFSYGVGMRARYYPSEALAKLYLGAVLEYDSARLENATALIATNTTFLIPGVEVGYRYPLGHFFLGGGAMLGYAAELTREVENLPGGNAAQYYVGTDESSVYGTVSLELGAYF